MTEQFAKLNGENVYCITLENDFLKAEILSYGATLKSLYTKDRNGNFIDVCLGYDTLEEYVSRGGYLGATVGRYANRIGGASFTLGKKEYKLIPNNNGNSLHGGKVGFDKKIWNFVDGGDYAEFSLVSPDGEEGFPGNAEIKVTYRLIDSELEISYLAKSDKDTLMNMTNHSYFNLGGHNSGNVFSHTLKINADYITPVDSKLIPTGELERVDNTVFDLRNGALLGDVLLSDELSETCGYDHNFVLNRECDIAATLTCPETGIRMDTVTTLEGLQIYSAGTLSDRIGKGGAQYSAHNAVCLETQHFPDSPNKPQFPSPILRAGDVWEHKTSYIFSNF